MHGLKEFETCILEIHSAVLKKVYTFLIYLEGLSLGISSVILDVFSVVRHFG